MQLRNKFLLHTETMSVTHLSHPDAFLVISIPHLFRSHRFCLSYPCWMCSGTGHSRHKLSSLQPSTHDLKRSARCMATFYSHESVDRNDAASTGPRISPHHGLTAEEAVKVQLDALLRNNEPRKDHGIEVMYHFANAEGTLDGGSLSCYFGFPADLYHFGHFCMKFKSRFQKLLTSRKFHIDSETLGYSCESAAARIRVLISGTDDSISVWTFILSKVQRGKQKSCWMTDAIIEEQIYEML